MYRIAHWGTGAVGSHALRTMLERSDYEIVGHHVFDLAKEGRDSAELIGLSPSGLTTTHDIDALIALKPDVLAYFGNAMTEPLETVRMLARFLEAGINVIGTGLYELQSRESAPPEFLEIVEPACEKGRSSIYNGGADPGFGTSQLPLAAYAVAHRVEQVRLQEFADYSTYPDGETMRHIMGFGAPIDVSTPITRGELQPRVWTGTVMESARALGLEIESLRTDSNLAPALKDRETVFGTIEEGTSSALWFQLIGVVDGEDRIVLEHLNWLHPDDIPEGWPVPPRFRGEIVGVGYRVAVNGDPTFDIEYQMRSTYEGLMGTALHVTNAIPAVVAAPPGILEAAMLVPYGPRNLTAPRRPA